MISVPEWAGLTILGILGFLLGLGIKRLLEGQDAMVKSQGRMNAQLIETCGKLEASKQIQDAHKNACDERHENNILDHANLRHEIEKLEPNQRRS